MSDVGNDGAAAATVPSFTERELQMLGWAMQSLKSGPPEIDYEKLAGFAGMGNPRSASNAWAKIRGKLQLNSDTAPTKNTPKKKAAAKKDDSKDGDEGGDTPKKTPRKRAAKKQEVDGGDVSPKKKGRRPANAKQVSEDETADTKADVKPEVKAEDSGDSQDLEPNGDAAVADEAAEEV